MKKWIPTLAALVTMLSGAARAQDNALTAAEVQDGFALLFDGTLNGFKANFVDYVQGNANNTNLDAKWVVDNTCKCITLPSGSTADIRSKIKYKDFDLRLHFRIDNNQGIVYRHLLTQGRDWQTGIEYAINNVTNLGKDNPGAAYDLYAPNPITYKLYNTGAWNTARIVVKADSVEHWMNEVKVVGFKYHSKGFWDAYNLSKWNSDSWLTNKVAGDRNSGYIEEGYFGLQGDHGGKWIIKNFKVSNAPCFGPINANGSSCATTSIGEKSSLGTRVAFTQIRQAADRITLAFDGKEVRKATLVGLDGKVVALASLSDQGRKGIFTMTPKAGLYFLKLEIASGTVTQKLNLL